MLAGYVFAEQDADEIHPLGEQGAHVVDYEGVSEHVFVCCGPKRLDHRALQAVDHRHQRLQEGLDLIVRCGLRAVLNIAD
ncbi:hypothetical protein GCM10010336_69730 [Streptomyces goshikiensis]|nr:hypothetical protein GCM10010336_69730 [Streptomyces goshikiensis]